MTIDEVKERRSLGRLLTESLKSMARLTVAELQEIARDDKELAYRVAAAKMLLRSTRDWP